MAPHIKDASDADLVAQIRAGNTAAFEALDARYRAAILHYCRQLLADRDEAEDAVQHTFLAAYTSIVASDADIEVRPWLYVIARNRCYSILRSRREVTVAELDHGTSEEPGALVQRREDLRDLVLDVSRLPEDQRAALVMAELGARSHDEIAGVLEVPRAKVKALVFQARESLVATRTARETDCADIRRQLRTVRGGGLRRGTLRRHLHECAGCREYRRQLRVQRARFAGFLPLAPWLGLRDLLARSATVDKSAPVTGAAGTASAAAIKVGAIKPLAGALAAVLSAASAVVAVHSIARSHPVSHPGPGLHRAVHHTPAGHGRASARSTPVGHRVVLTAAVGTRRVNARHRPAAVGPSAGPARTRAAGRASWIDRRALGRVVARHTARQGRVFASSPRTPAAKPAPPATSGPPAPPPGPLPVIQLPPIPINLPTVPPPLLVHGPNLPPREPGLGPGPGPGDGPGTPGHDGPGKPNPNEPPAAAPPPPAVSHRPHTPVVPAKTPAPPTKPVVVTPPAPKPTAPGHVATPAPPAPRAPKPTPPGHTVAPGHSTAPPPRPVAPPHSVPVHTGSTA